MQSAFLQIKLKNLNRWLESRESIAEKYLTGINNPKIKLPERNPNGKHVWHIFAVLAENRELLEHYLEQHEIGYQVHYPMAMHLHQAYSDLGYQKGDFPIAEMAAEHELSLPIYYGMTEEQLQYVIDVLNQYR